ncbi:uncharacterized protein BJX67DRAFT_362284 [Aspergillus lucknowensis]|uniref:Uncharacterized protein n=1 Tax=Aspergillus lucknowensis TaxID=176173 RepID=A0ABR4LHR4_9EURO
MLIMWKLLTSFRQVYIPVLFADECGYEAGNILCLGHFNAPADEPPTGTFPRVIGRPASGFSVYANGKRPRLLVRRNGMCHSTRRTSTSSLSFRRLWARNSERQRPTREAVLALITTDAISASGNHPLEPIRGTYNEGGLHAKRLGRHLSSFNDTARET